MAQLKIYTGVLLLLFAFTSCKNNAKNKEQKSYIDVTGYMNGQLKYFDTVPFAFLKLTRKDTVFTDSQYIRKEQVQQIVKQFLVKEIEKGNFEENFEETTFADATLQMVTITYSANNKKPGVERIDVYVNPEEEKIRQLYMVRKKEQGDSTVNQQLLWRHNKSFTLITSVTNAAKQEKTVTEKIIWDERED
jgi:hypothetical protein